MREMQRSWWERNPLPQPFGLRYLPPNAHFVRLGDNLHWKELKSGGMPVDVMVWLILSHKTDISSTAVD